MPEPGSTPPSLAGAEWLVSAPTQRVMRAIAEGGFEVRAVGGVVRNSLFGIPISDIDLATTALPADVMRLAKAAGLGVVETGIDHGTVTLIADHHPFEVTTLRRDVSTDGRRATVAFTTDWAEDAQRRDFTINAIYCDAAGQVHDPLGGYPDILARRVRFVGNAVPRIREDFLRILRFFRFSAQYGEGPLDAEGLAASTREREGIASLSAERIRQEFVRLIVARRGIEHLAAMQEHGVLAFVLPIAPRPGLLRRLSEVEAATGRTGDAMTRLGALAVGIEEDVGVLARHLRLSRDERAVLALAARAEARLAALPEERQARVLLYRHGAADYTRLLMLSLARLLPTAAGDSAWMEAIALPGRWSAPKLPVYGSDVLAAGVESGPRVGQILREIETRWIADDFATSRDALIASIAASARTRR